LLALRDHCQGLSAAKLVVSPFGRGSGIERPSTM
jgi:hypothetical protein